MTVCVAVKVYDCIVLAADSAVTISGNEGIRNVWQHGNKVFHLHNHLPIAAMTAGMGSFGPASVSQLAKDLRILLSSSVRDGGLAGDYTIRQAIDTANNFFFGAYSKHVPTPDKSHTFDFWIGGYGAQGFEGEIWKCGIQEGAQQDPELVVNPKNPARAHATFLHACCFRTSTFNRTLQCGEPTSARWTLCGGTDSAFS